MLLSLIGMTWPSCPHPSDLSVLLSQQLSQSLFPRSWDAEAAHRPGRLGPVPLRGRSPRCSCHFKPAFQHFKHDAALETWLWDLNLLALTAHLVLAHSLCIFCFEVYVLAFKNLTRSQCFSPSYFLGSSAASLPLSTPPVPTCPKAESPGSTQASWGLSSGLAVTSCARWVGCVHLILP